mmetsp:Transcript_46378/g.110452  ORF Transcript_46378/g.110452 Transcript_46378/m.110452 type:complete len:860 (-) Transcript_46378:41-2620(-)
MKARDASVSALKQSLSFSDLVLGLHDDLMHVVRQLPSLLEQHEHEVDNTSSTRGSAKTSFGSGSRVINQPLKLQEESEQRALVVASEKTPIINGILPAITIADVTVSGTMDTVPSRRPRLVSLIEEQRSDGKKAMDASFTTSFEVSRILSDPSVEPGSSPQPVYISSATPTCAREFNLREQWRDVEVSDAFHGLCLEKDAAAGNLRATSHPSNIFEMSTKKSGRHGRGRHDWCWSICKSNTGCSWTIHPQSRQRIVWDLLSVLFIAYDIFVVPLAAFRWSGSLPEPIWQRMLEWTCVSFWSVDMIMNFRTGYNEGPSVEMAPRKIVVNYLKTWFTIDFLILLAEWTAELFQTVEGFNAGRMSRFIRMIRMCKLLRVAKLQSFSGKLETGLNSTPVAIGFGMLKLGLYLLVGVHLLTCGWYAIGNSSHGNWVKLLDEEDQADLFFSYAISARWTLAQINGRTDQEKERTMLEMAYTCFCALLAVVLVSLFVGTITTNMVELQRLWQEPLRHLRLLNAYLEHRGKISFQTAWFARKHLQNVKQLQGDKEIEDELLSMLPKSLQLHLLYEVRSPVLNRHHLFEEFDLVSRKVIMYVCFRMVLRPARPHEVIFEDDDEATSMYFIELGIVRYEKGKLAQEHNLAHMENDSNMGKLRKKVNVFNRVWSASSGETESSSAEGEAEDEDSTPDPNDAITLTAGSWVAEPALWIDNWRHRGMLACNVPSTLLTLDANTLINTVASDEECMRCFAIYGCSFAERLGEIEVRDELTDIITSRVVDIPFSALLKPKTLEPYVSEEVSRPGNWFRVASPFATNKPAHQDSFIRQARSTDSHTAGRGPMIGHHHSWFRNSDQARAFPPVPEQ